MTAICKRDGFVNRECTAACDCLQPGHYFHLVPERVKQMDNTTSNQEHEVKSWTHLFAPLWDGTKTHDLRIMDRDYQVGDTLLMQEYDWVERTYTGRAVRARITYITAHNHQQCAFSPYVMDKRFGILSITIQERIEGPKP